MKKKQQQQQQLYKICIICTRVYKSIRVKIIIYLKVYHICFIYNIYEHRPSRTWILQFIIYYLYISLEIINELYIILYIYIY